MDNNEKLALKNRKPLKDVAAPLREQIPAKLTQKLEDLYINKRIAEMWALADKDRAEWFNRQRAYLQDSEEFLVRGTDGPFDGSSNLHLPISFMICKAYLARIYDSVYLTDPPFAVRARREDGVSSEEAVSSLMRYAIYDWSNHYKGCNDVVKLWIWKYLKTGTGILKIRWDRQFSKFTDVETYAKQSKEVITGADGKETVSPKVEFKEREIEKVMTCFDGPVIESINPEDLVIIGGDEIQTADAVIHRQYLNASELWTLADQKIFDSEAVKKVIDHGKDNINSGLAQGLKQQRDLYTGISSNREENELKRYEILECYLKVDVDGSGINSDVVVWIHNTSRKILRSTYLYRANKQGKRPFVMRHMHKRDGLPYGMGLPEMLYPLTTELDAIHNQRIDFGMLSNMPFGFYRASSSLNPETLQLAPGAMIAVDNPQTDVHFPSMSNRTAWGAQEEANVWAYIEKLSNYNDMIAGSMQSQGAARTATGAAGLRQESATNFAVYIKEVLDGWTEAMSILFCYLQQNVDPGFAFRVTGDDGSRFWKKVQTEQLYYEYDFEISHDKATNNRQSRVELANQLIQLTSNPLDYQLGIITPAQRYEALKKYLQANQIKDINKFIQSPPEYSYIPTPAEEINRILNGQDVPVLPQGKHKEFMAYLEEIMKTPEIFGAYPPQMIGKLRDQYQKHEQMQSALDQQQAQQNNIMQQQMNSQMAGQQPDLQQTAVPNMGPQGQSPQGNPQGAPPVA